MENNGIGPNDLCIFIDESGDLGKFGSAYFTIAALATRDSLKLGRIIKRVRQRKLKKKFKKLPEIKANNSNESIRKFVLSQIGSCNCDISAIAIPKTKVKEYMFNHKEKLYNYLCGLLFAHISLDVGKVYIVIDKKHSNRLLRADFNQYIESRIRERASKIEVSIAHLESHSSNELQAVDFVAWAIGRKYSSGDSSYYDMIKSRIRNLGKEEIWK